MTNFATVAGTTSGPELLIRLHGGGRRRAQLEDRLRELVRDGTLTPGTRLPSSRVLAGDLGASRRLVLEAYAQLLAEGYLVARQGSGTFVAGARSQEREPSASAPRPRLRFDFFPGQPDLTSFPRALWLRALRQAITGAPSSAFGYPHPRGALDLRRALAGYLRRVRGVDADPRRIVICSGASQGLALLARALGQGALVAVEDPSLAPHREVLVHAGATLDPMPVDEAGLDPQRLSDHKAVLITPAHQFPTGVVLAPERRAALLDWAARCGGVLIEDDYDAEFRYDRAPVGALQGLDPERVVYVGTASKALAPALRIGWMVLPAHLLARVVEAKAYDDGGNPMIEQLALAHLIESAAYDRHLRQARRRNRARRDALLAAVDEWLPGSEVTGVSAGLHAVVCLGFDFDAAALVAAAAERSVGVYPLAFFQAAAPPRSDALVLGYAGLSEPAIREGLRRLAQALR